MEELARAWRGNLVCNRGQLEHAPGMSSSTSHRQFHDVAPSPASQERSPRALATTTSQLRKIPEGRGTLTLQHWGTLVPHCGTTQRPKRPQNGPGWEMVTPYHLLTYPDESGMGRSRATPPGCTSQGEQTVAPQLLCTRGDSLEHPPSCCCPRPHPCGKRNQSMTPGSSHDQQALCSAQQLLGSPK